MIFLHYQFANLLFFDLGSFIYNKLILFFIINVCFFWKFAIFIHYQFGILYFIFLINDFNFNHPLLYTYRRIPIPLVKSMHINFCKFPIFHLSKKRNENLNIINTHQKLNLVLIISIILHKNTKSQKLYAKQIKFRISTLYSIIIYRFEQIKHYNLDLNPKN